MKAQEVFSHPDVSDSDVLDQDVPPPDFLDRTFRPLKCWTWTFNLLTFWTRTFHTPTILDLDVSPLTFWTRKFRLRSFWTWMFRVQNVSPLKCLDLDNSLPDVSDQVVSPENIFSPRRFAPCLFGPGRFAPWYVGPVPFAPWDFAPGRFGPGRFAPRTFRHGTFWTWTFRYRTFRTTTFRPLIIVLLYKIYVSVEICHLRDLRQILVDLASQSMWHYDVTSGTIRHYLKLHIHSRDIRTLHHKPCNMKLWWSILDTKPNSEYEILFASKTSSLLQKYFDEIVHWRF